MEIGTKTIYWAITTNCQLKCKYCFYETGLMDKFPNSFNPELAIKLLPELSEIFHRVVFTGGEPLMYNAITDIIQKAKSTGLEVGIVTNGILLTKRIIDNLLIPYVDILNVSIDSIDSLIQLYLRPSRHGANFSKTVLTNLTTLAKYRSSFIHINILQTITKKNISSISPMAKFCKEFNFTHYLHPVRDILNTSLSEEFSLLKCTEFELRELSNSFKNWAGNDRLNLNYINLILDVISGKEPSDLQCRMGSDIFFMNVDGSIYPCFYRTDMPMGNVLTERFNNIFNHKISKLNNVLEPLHKAKCYSLGCSNLLNKEKIQTQQIEDTKIENLADSV